MKDLKGGSQDRVFLCDLSDYLSIRSLSSRFQNLNPPSALHLLRFEKGANSVRARENEKTRFFFAKKNTKAQKKSKRRHHFEHEHHATMSAVTSNPVVLSARARVAPEASAVRAAAAVRPAAFGRRVQVVCAAGKKGECFFFPPLFVFFFFRPHRSLFVAHTPAPIHTPLLHPRNVVCCARRQSATPLAPETRVDASLPAYPNHERGL